MPSIALKLGIVISAVFFSALLNVEGQTPGTPPSQAYQTAYSAAIQAFNENRYPEALAKLDEAEAVEPGLVSTLNLRGAIHVNQREFTKAAESFHKIIPLDPDNDVAHFNYGETLFLMKNYAQAKESFQRYLNTKGNQKNALGRFKVLLCDILGGNIEQARKTVAELRPTISHPLEYFARAALLFHAGKDEEARGYLVSAFDIYQAGMNLAFADSFVEIGWLKREEVAQIGAVNAAALQSLSNEFQPVSEGSDQSLSEKFQSLLPSLSGNKKE